MIDLYIFSIVTNLTTRFNYEHINCFSNVIYTYIYITKNHPRAKGAQLIDAFNNSSITSSDIAWFVDEDITLELFNCTLFLQELYFLQ